MKILLCVISAIFGVLSTVAAVSQLKSDKKQFTAYLMTAGSLTLIAAVILNIVSWRFDYIPAILGCIAICAAAIWNGVKSKQFHIQHHIIRMTLSLVLIIGFIFL